MHFRLNFELCVNALYCDSLLFMMNGMFCSSNPIDFFRMCIYKVESCDYVCQIWSKSDQEIYNFYIIYVSRMVQL